VTGVEDSALNAPSNTRPATERRGIPRTRG
jgi:hypothetical protein